MNPVSKASVPSASTATALNPAPATEVAEQDLKAKSAADEQFEKLTKSYEEILSKALENSGWELQHDERRLFHVFLDKIKQNPNLTPAEIERIGKNEIYVTVLAAQELIQALKIVIQDQHLDPRVKDIIQKVLFQLTQTLPIATVVNGILARFPELKFFETEIPDVALIEDKIDKKEIAIVVDKITSSIKQLKPGESFQCVSGTLTHDTQLVVKRELDGTYTLLNYDSAGDKEYPTLMKFQKLSEAQVTDPKFWGKIINSKLTNVYKTLFYNYFEEFGKMETETDKTALRPIQAMGTCTYQSILGLIRYKIVTEFAWTKEEAAQYGQDPNAAKLEGLEQFKYCLSLIKSHALNAKETTDPHVVKLATEQESISRRYLLWQKLIAKGKGATLQLAFLKTIASFVIKGDDKFADTNAILAKIANKTPLQALNILHKQLLTNLVKCKATRAEVNNFMAALEDSAIFKAIKPTFLRYLYKLKI